MSASIRLGFEADVKPCADRFDGVAQGGHSLDFALLGLLILGWHGEGAGRGPRALQGAATQAAGSLEPTGLM